MKLYSYQYHSVIGVLTILCTEKELLCLTTESVCDQQFIHKKTPFIQKVIKWLDLYFNGSIPTFTIPLNPKGTEFQKLVWQELQTIPYGQSRSYQQIANQVAKRLGKETMSSQAVGQAVSKNPIFLFIPCHRVIGKKNALVGFRAGLDIKKKLLNLEQIPYSDSI